MGEAIPVPGPSPQLSSCIAAQLSLHRETRVQYTSVHHGKWRGKEHRANPPPSPMQIIKRLEHCVTVC